MIGAAISVTEKKKDVLMPTYGIGDYFYYSLWISGIHTVSDSIFVYSHTIFSFILKLPILKRGFVP